MKRRISFFQIFMTIMSVIIAGLLLASGIIALQKSMNMKVGVNITPSHEIRIDYGGETIFCNTTKDSAETPQVIHTFTVQLVCAITALHE